MKRYILTRIILSIFTILFVVSMVQILLTFSHYVRWTRGIETIDMIRMTWDSYTEFVVNVVTKWDWGSNQANEPVWDIVRNKIGVSLRINLFAFVIYITIGVGLGILTAIKKDSILDRLVSVLTLTLGSIPSFIWVFVLMIFLGWRWGLVPTLYTSGRPGFFNQLHILIIPILALIMEPISKFIRIVRAEVIEDMQSEYILLLRAKGLTRSQIIRRHTLKNVTVIILPEMTTTFVYVITSSFFIEYFYRVLGVARLLLQSIISFGAENKYVMVDTTMVTAVTMFYITFIVIAALIIDVIWALLDPRIKITGKKTN